MNVINFDNRNCQKVRAYLDSYINNELMVETYHEVLKHLESCSDCSGELEARLRVKNLLQNAVKRDAAPAELRERIQRELHKTSPPVWRYLVAAAAMAVLLAGGWSALRLWRSPAATESSYQAGIRHAGAEVLKVGLDNHVHCAVERQFADRRFTAEEMSSRLGPDFSGLVSLVEREAPGKYEVVIGHRCRANKREYVHLILKSHQTSLSLVITKKNGETFEGSELPPVLKAAGVSLYSSRLESYEVAGFETREYLAFVVYNVAGGDNSQVAAVIAPGVRDYLAALEG